MLLRKIRRRKGATLAESAIVFPLTFLLIFGLLTGGVATFRLNAVAHLAHEAARFASVHAGLYAQENTAGISKGTLPTVDAAYISKNVVIARAAGIDTANLTTTVSIITPNGTFDWDNTAKTNNRALTTTITTKTTSTVVTNTVSVTVSYKWIPDIYWVGPITLKSTAVLPVSY